MKFAIIGGRNFDNYEKMEYILWDLFHIRRTTVPKDTIVSGGAKGADSLAKQYAEEEEQKYIEFLPDWNKFGKSAGFRRNQQIVDACDMVIAFWNGESKGTKHTIDLARKTKKPTFIVYF